MRRLVLVLTLAAACIALVACGGESDQPDEPNAVGQPDGEQPGDPAEPDDPREAGFLVTVGSLTIQTEIANDAGERLQGLSDRDSLARDAGMLFVFEQELQPSFWMSGMRFPLDFIWISQDLRVVDITENVPHPEPDTPTEDLPHYSPSEDVLYVLEVNGGVIDEAGVRIGDEVSFDPEDVVRAEHPATPDAPQ